MYMLKKSNKFGQKKNIIVEGFTIRKDSILKCGDISWRCTSYKPK